MSNFIKNNLGKTYFKLIIISSMFLIVVGLLVFVFLPNTNFVQQKQVVDFKLPAQYNQPLIVKTLDTIFSILPVNAAPAKKVSEGKNKVRYIDVYKQTDISQEILVNKIKEDIILKSPGHPDEFTYLIDLTQVDYQTEKKGDLVFYKKGYVGQELYKLVTIPAAFMIDSRGKQSSISDVKVIMQEDGRLTLTPSKTWLAQAEYPVKIDPSLEIEILNVHSHPQQGENWEVEFTTQGRADLKIIPNDQATIEDDEFVSLSCNGQIRQPKILAQDVIYYPNWSCNGIAKVVHYTLQAGNHTLRFEFGDQTAYAYNSSWLSGWDNRYTIYVDSDQIDSELTHFPIPMFINDSSGQTDEDLTSIFDEVGTNWKKIAVTESDGTSQLYVEKERWATTTLVAHWKMDDNAANSTISDYNDSYDMTYKDDSGVIDTSTGSSLGKVNGAIDFDGDDERVVSDSAPDINGSDPFTVSLWIKLDSLPSSEKYYAPFTFTESEDSGTWDKVIRISDSGDVGFYVYSGGVQEAIKSGVVSTGSWYHIVGSFDGTNVRVYVNDTAGTPDTAGGSYDFTSPIFELSFVPNVNYERVNGQIDDVRLYKKALSPSEVSTLYNSGDGTEAEDYADGGAVIWVSSSESTLSDFSDTTLYLYYDNTQSDNTDYVGAVGSRTEVWDDNFEAVYHLSESGRATDSRKDSTSNNNHLDNTQYHCEYDGNEDTSSGKIGNADNLDGDSYPNADCASNDSPSGLPSGDVAKTISAWLKSASEGGQGDDIVGGFGDDETGENFQTGRFSTNWRVMGWSDDWNTGYVGNNFLDATWHYVTVTYDGTQTDLYRDYTIVASTTAEDWVTDPQHIVLGNEIDKAGMPFQGILDEFRISSVDRSAAWIKADYQAAEDNLLTFLPNSAPTVSSVSDSPDSIGVGAELNFSVDWNDVDTGDMVKIHICKSSGITTSTQTCKDDGAWVDSDVFTNRDPENLIYTTSAGDAGTQNYWAFACDDDNACSDGTAGTFTVENQRPDAPLTLLVEGYETGQAINITDTTPEFSAVYKDTHDEGDVAEEYCIEVDTQSDFAGTDMWVSDSASCYSGSALGSNISESDRSEDFIYAGTTLSLDGSTYYWRIWFWDGGERSATSSTGWFTVANQDESGEGGVRLRSGRLRGDIRLK